MIKSRLSQHTQPQQSFTTQGYSSQLRNGRPQPRLSARQRADPTPCAETPRQHGFHNRLKHSNLNRSYHVSNCCSHETLSPHWSSQLHQQWVNNSPGFPLAAPTESPLWILIVTSPKTRTGDTRAKTSKTTHPQSPDIMVKYT